MTSISSSRFFWLALVSHLSPAKVLRRVKCDGNTDRSFLEVLLCATMVTTCIMISSSPKLFNFRRTLLSSIGRNLSCSHYIDENDSQSEDREKVRQM